MTRYIRACQTGDPLVACGPFEMYKQNDRTFSFQTTQRHLLAISYFTQFTHVANILFRLQQLLLFFQVHLSPIIHTNFKPDTKKLSANKRCAVSSRLSDHMLDTRTVPTGQYKSDLLSGLDFDSAIVYFMYS